MSLSTIILVVCAYLLVIMLLANISSELRQMNEQLKEFWNDHHKQHPNKPKNIEYR